MPTLHNIYVVKSISSLYLNFNCENYIKKGKEKWEVTCKKQDSKSVYSSFPWT